MILAEAVAQQDPLIFNVSAGLLILVLLYLLWGVHKDYRDYLPINRESLKQWYKQYLSFKEARSKRLAESKDIVVEGKLHKGIQWGVIITFLLVWVFCMYKVGEIIIDSNDIHSLFLFFLLGFVMELYISIDSVRALYAVKKLDAEYYPPVPKSQPYFDSTSVYVTPDKVKEWQKDAWVKLPIYLIMVAVTIYMPLSI